MQAMQALMERIQATEDPEERRRFMQEHMQSMRQGMMTMGEMMRVPMGQGAGRGGRAGQCGQGDTNCRMEQMQIEQRMMGQNMGMMRQMMQQMMEHMQQQAEDQQNN
jgi:2-methylcitrate dehydratase PrpD